MTMKYDIYKKMLQIQVSTTDSSPCGNFSQTWKLQVEKSSTPIVFCHLLINIPLVHEDFVVGFLTISSVI